MTNSEWEYISLHCYWDVEVETWVFAYGGQKYKEATPDAMVNSLGGDRWELVSTLIMDKLAGNMLLFKRQRRSTENK